MTVYRTLILAGVFALSADAAMAGGLGGRGGSAYGDGNDGMEEARIRNEIFNTTPAPWQRPALREGRAATEGRAPVRRRVHGRSQPTNTYNY